MKDSNRKKVLMCAPIHYDIKYSINPWMKDYDEPLNKELALAQWLRLYSTIDRMSDVTIEALDTAKTPNNCPDIVFTANAGIVHNNKVILSNFKHPERHCEKPFYRKWFEDKGYEVDEILESLYFEGGGDCIVVGDKLVAGYGFRSEHIALELVAEKLDLELHAFKLADPRFYHLDTCLSILDPETGSGFFYPKAFEDPKALKKILKLKSVSKRDAMKFCCNSVVLGDNVVIPAGSKKILEFLREKGYNVFEVEMSEFIKSGGAAQCLVLYLN